jgi:hypothetical protein
MTTMEYAGRAWTSNSWVYRTSFFTPGCIGLYGPSNAIRIRWLGNKEKQKATKIESMLKRKLLLVRPSVDQQMLA